MSYERDGYVCPIRVLDDREVARFRDAYDEYEALMGERLASVPPAIATSSSPRRTHSCPWAFELATRPARARRGRVAARPGPADLGLALVHEAAR